MINNLGTRSSKLQINFGVLLIDTENSATGVKTSDMDIVKFSVHENEVTQSERRKVKYCITQ